MMIQNKLLIRIPIPHSQNDKNRTGNAGSKEYIKIKTSKVKDSMRKKSKEYKKVEKTKTIINLTNQEDLLL